MDESDRLYSIKNQEEKITFKEDCNETISEEFARHFSIDDDDIVILDESQIILYEVKIILDHLITNILNRESQIKNLSNKRLLDLNNDNEYLWNKKVRFNPDHQQQLSNYLFISETINSSKQLKPYNQFLSNLGFDLCLEENLNNNNYHLSEIDQQTLIKYNKIFHQEKIYSCKYCSFKTDTIHVLEYHYRTPHIYHENKFRCTYCSYYTFRLTKLRYHCYKKHQYILVHDPDVSRYPCCYCSYETHDKRSFRKHNKICQIEQKRACIENNLLAPNRNLNTQIKTKTNSKKNNNNQSIIKPNTVEIIEPILIESDHDDSLSRSSSDEEFIVSSDDDSSSSSTDNENVNKRNLDIPTSRHKITQSSTSLSITQPTNNLTALSKLLLLNGSSIPSFTNSLLNSNKPSLIPIQPKPTSGADVYQMCNLCQCYIFKNDFIRHMNEKHPNSSSQPQQTIPSTPIIILNTPTTNTNTSITSIKPALIVSKGTSQPSTTIFLLSTSTMNSQATLLNMIKCPWCDTNFEHIDIMTGHLMRYHRMTLAAAKVVVAEQMKIQGTSSKELSVLFQQEIEQIQKEFSDKIYWKISQPKVYLHQLETISCFVCNINIDDIENHLLSTHQIQLKTMNTIKQCCLCGFRCDKKNSSLFEHQLRTHSGVCYSIVLKQFIRFEPPPPILTRINNRLILPSSSSPQRNLTTYTEKKFGCRKCDTSSGLFTFEELIEHLRLNHDLNVKLHRRCLICQQTFPKGKEYNQHCLEHLNDEYPLIKLRKKILKKR